MFEILVQKNDDNQCIKKLALFQKIHNERALVSCIFRHTHTRVSAGTVPIQILVALFERRLTITITISDAQPFIQLSTSSSKNSSFSVKLLVNHAKIFEQKL